MTFRNTLVRRKGQKEGAKGRGKMLVSALARRTIHICELSALQQSQPSHQRAITPWQLILGLSGMAAACAQEKGARLSMACMPSHGFESLGVLSERVRFVSARAYKVRRRQERVQAVCPPLPRCVRS
jgi:hypothetical protein